MMDFIAQSGTDQFLDGFARSQSGAAFLTSPAFWSVLLSAIGAGVLSFLILSMRRRDAAELGPATRRYCRTLGLTTPQRRLLQRLARASGVTSPISLLVSHGAFVHAVDGYALNNPSAGNFAPIERRVFGEETSGPAHR